MGPDNEDNLARALVLYARDGEDHMEALAGRLREAIHSFSKGSVDTILVDMEELAGRELPEHNALIVMFPARQFDSPAPVQAWLRRLPAGQNRPAFVFCDASRRSVDTILWLNLQRLARRGYHAIGGLSVRSVNDPGQQHFEDIESIAIALVGLCSPENPGVSRAAMMTAVSRLTLRPSLFGLAVNRVAALWNSAGSL